MNIADCYDREKPWSIDVSVLASGFNKEEKLTLIFTVLKLRLDMALTKMKLLRLVLAFSTSPTVRFCPGLFHRLSSVLIDESNASMITPNF